MDPPQEKRNNLEYQTFEKVTEVPSSVPFRHP